jgi:hypothetical protein
MIRMERRIGCRSTMIDDSKWAAIARGRAKERRVFEHLCENGKPFTPIKRPKGFRQMRRKDCFRNSQSLAIDGRATYVEGLCVWVGFPGLAFAHGWLTLDGEHAIDVTLPDAESYAYFGIVFDRKALAQAINRAGYFQSHLGLTDTMDAPPQLAEAVRRSAHHTGAQHHG